MYIYYYLYYLVVSCTCSLPHLDNFHDNGEFISSNHKKPNTAASLPIYFKIPFAFSQLIQGLIDGEDEFVKEMKAFTCHQLNYLDSSHHVPINILNQKEIIFRNIKDIVFLHER